MIDSSSVHSFISFFFSFFFNNLIRVILALVSRGRFFCIYVLLIVRLAGVGGVFVCMCIERGAREVGVLALCVGVECWLWIWIWEMRWMHAANELMPLRVMCWMVIRE